MKNLFADQQGTSGRPYPTGPTCPVRACELDQQWVFFGSSTQEPHGPCGVEKDTTGVRPLSYTETFKFLNKISLSLRQLILGERGLCGFSCGVVIKPWQTGSESCVAEGVSQMVLGVVHFSILQLV